MAIVLFALLGVAVDMGRMFIIKHEAQVFTDSAALAGALKLDGTQAGATEADAAVNASTNKWNMGTQAFTSYAASYANSATGPWLASGSVPGNATGYTYVKVTAALTVPVYFIGVVTPITTTPINAMSVAAQMPDTTLYAGGFPFSPQAFAGSSLANPTYGFTVGTQYTIRYPDNVAKPVCTGDQGFHTGFSPTRGYWGDNSASVIRQRIVDDYQSGATVTIGQSINITGGAKTSEATFVDERAAQDGDVTSTSLAAYEANSSHNGRRLVNMPITDYTSGIALGYGMFLLLPPGNYGHTGNSAWCAIYVGPGLEAGTDISGAASPGSGLSHVRLVQ
jgi:hypothetical protein